MYDVNTGQRMKILNFDWQILLKLTIGAAQWLLYENQRTKLFRCLFFDAIGLTNLYLSGN